MWRRAVAQEAVLEPLLWQEHPTLCPPSPQSAHASPGSPTRTRPSAPAHRAVRHPQQAVECVHGAGGRVERGGGARAQHLRHGGQRGGVVAQQDAHSGVAAAGAGRREWTGGQAGAEVRAERGMAGLCCRYTCFWPSQRLLAWLLLLGRLRAAVSHLTRVGPGVHAGRTPAASCACGLPFTCIALLMCRGVRPAPQPLPSRHTLPVVYPHTDALARHTRIYTRK